MVNVISFIITLRPHRSRRDIGNAASTVMTRFSAVPDTRMISELR